MSSTTKDKYQVPPFTFHPSVSPFAVSSQLYLADHSNEKFNYIATGALVFDTSCSPPRILLIQRSAHDSMPNRWEVPGGGCDDEDETILHAVARELWEEAGLKATRIDASIGDPHFFTSRSGKKICKFNFIVLVDSDSEDWLKVKLDPEEHQSFVWATEDEVKARRVGDIELKFTTEETERTVIDAFDRVKSK
ncbi:hypothetical protein M426DRAFT_10608 [Hypoxylon sp. CI-4A]|nr:hypothetical protein M426DRAFT_10608 [Hypoxylon sp. CI-4A]